MAKDLRETIFEALERRTFTAEIRVRISGLVCGLDAACRKAEALGCEVVSRIREGGVAQANAVVLTLKGSAQALAMAEDVVPGSIGKTSGVARAARKSCGTGRRTRAHHLRRGEEAPRGVQAPGEAGTGLRGRWSAHRGRPLHLPGQELCAHVRQRAGHPAGRFDNAGIPEGNSAARSASGPGNRDPGRPGHGSRHPDGGHRHARRPGHRVRHRPRAGHA